MVDASFRTNACASSNSEVNYIEQVEVVVTIKADVRGSVEIHLVSPMGTNSLLLSVSPTIINIHSLGTLIF